MQNPDSVSIFNSTVLTLNLQMSMPTSILGFKLKEIAIATKLVAQSANRLVLNPTKKSIKAAFGIEIGNEWAKIKAYIERNYTNY